MRTSVRSDAGSPSNGPVLHEPGREHGVGVGRVVEHITIDERPVVDPDRPDPWESVCSQLTRPDPARATRGLLGNEGHGQKQPPHTKD